MFINVLKRPSYTDVSSCMVVFHARDGLKTRWRVLSNRTETHHGGLKRSSDGSLIIHRRKKKKVEKIAKSTEPKSRWEPTVTELDDFEGEAEQLTWATQHHSSVACNQMESDSCDETAVEDIMLIKNGGIRSSSGTLQRRTWEYRYNELIEYQNIHGHCEVPRTLRGMPTHSPLGKWVANQRESYKKYLKGEPSSLTEAKVDMLQLIGFTWRVEKSTSQSTQYSKSD